MAGSGFEIELLREHGRLLELKPEWDALVARSGPCASVFMTCDWYDCWWRHFGRDSQLQVVTFRRGGRLCGAAPFMIRRIRLYGLPVRCLGFIENGNSLHSDLLFDAAEREALLEELLRFLASDQKNWDLLQLYRMPADSPNLPLLLELLGRRGIRHQLRSAYASPFLKIQGGWEAFHASRSTRVRKTLRNVENSLARAGSLEVIELRSLEEYLLHREGIYQVARNSWTEEVGDSLASPANRPFFDELAQKAAAAGRLSVWLLLVDRRPVAFEYHLHDFGRQHALRASYDREFASRSPGAFLEMQALKRLFARGDQLSEFDFGGSFDLYKKRWSDDARELVLLQAFNDTPYSRLCAFHTLKLVKLARGVRDRLRRET